MGLPDDVGRNLPINDLYRDVAQPAAREVGEVLGNVAMAARFLVAPIEYLAAQQGRWQRYLSRVVEKVPEERRIEGHPQLVGPALEKLRYVDETNIIAELFVNLLARSIDRERVSEAHPAFATIIGQLSSDEALVLYHLKQSEFRLEHFLSLKADKNLFLPGTCTVNEFPTERLAFPNVFETYLDHLYSLNLIQFVEKQAQEPTFEEGTRKQTGVIIRRFIRLSKFGQLFATACVPDQFPMESQRPEKNSPG